MELPGMKSAMSGVEKHGDPAGQDIGSEGLACLVVCSSGNMFYVVYMYELTKMTSITKLPVFIITFYLYQQYSPTVLMASRNVYVAILLSFLHYTQHLGVDTKSKERSHFRAFQVVLISFFFDTS